MAETFHLEIITPDRKFFTEEVEELVINTPQGQVGILKNHMPMVTAISIGNIRIKQDGNWKDAVVSEGFMEITGDKAIAFCDTAEWPDEIDINRAKAAEDRARERLQGEISYKQYVQSQAALQRAMSRLRVTTQK